TVAAAPGVGGLMQVPDAFVWQMVRVRGRLRGDAPNGVVVGMKVTVPGAPMLMAGTAMTPVPLVPVITGLPSRLGGAGTDGVSGIATALAVSRNVLRPATLRAGGVFAQAKISGMSCDIGWLGVMAKKNDWLWPAGMVAGVLATPTGVLVAGSVVW